MRHKGKLTSITLICLLLINMVFDAFLGAELLNYRYFFIAGSLCLAIAAQGMALTKLFRPSRAKKRQA